MCSTVMQNGFDDKAQIVSIHAKKKIIVNICLHEKRQYNKEMKCFNNHNSRLEVEGQHAKFICNTLHSFTFQTDTDLLVTGHNHAKGRQTHQRGDNHALLTWRGPPPSLVSGFHSHAQLSTRSAEPDLLVGYHSDQKRVKSSYQGDCLIQAISKLHSNQILWDPPIYALTLYLRW